MICWNYTSWLQPESLPAAPGENDPSGDLPCTHVNALGSDNPLRRELPEDLLLGAGLIAVDPLEQARIESGDLLLALPPKQWDRLPVVELQRVVAGQVARADPNRVAVFRSNGLGVEDVAAAAWVYEQALQAGAGVTVDWLYS